MKSLFEQMGGTYTLGADGIYYPNLSLPEEEEPRYGKYGRMRHAYLKAHYTPRCLTATWWPTSTKSMTPPTSEWNS